MSSRRFSSIAVSAALVAGIALISLLGASTKINWATQIGNFPAACSSGQYVTGVGATLSCSLPSTMVTSAATNFGTNLGTITMISSLPQSGFAHVTMGAGVVTAGVGCLSSTDTVYPTVINWTAPGGTAESEAADLPDFLSVSSNPAIDAGNFFTYFITANSGGTIGAYEFTVIAKQGTAITVTVDSALGGGGCSTTPQYEFYSRVTQ